MLPPTPLFVKNGRLLSRAQTPIFDPFADLLGYHFRRINRAPRLRLAGRYIEVPARCRDNDHTKG